MKKVLPVIVLLLLSSSSTASASAVSQGQASWQQHQGILDRAAKKIRKEEDEKKQEIQAQARMVVEADHLQQQKAIYDKNYKKAALEASKIMTTATDNELQGLKSALITQAPAPAPAPAPMLAPVPAPVPAPAPMPVVPKPVHKQAPQVFTQVLSQPQEAPISTTTLQRMKAKMHAKLDQHTTTAMPAPFIEPPKQPVIQSLGTIPFKKAPEPAHDQMESDDFSVTSLMSQYAQQKRSEQEANAREDKAKEDKVKEDKAKIDDEDKQQREFEKQVMYGESQQKQQSIVQAETDSVSSYTENTVQQTKKSDEPEMPIDNPISQMMALKHPEKVKAIEDATIEDMAQSHNSRPNRGGVLM